jgi:hypothetical protein
MGRMKLPHHPFAIATALLAGLGELAALQGWRLRRRLRRR